MKELIRLVERCKGEVIISANQHKSGYHSIQDYLTNFRDDICNEVYDVLIDSENFYEIQFYPLSPVGFYTVYHYDLELAVAECHNVLDNKS